MNILPLEALPLLAHFAPVFTQPTDHRSLILTAAAILTTGRRNVANLLRTVGAAAPGHRTSYQRVLSHAHWSSLRLACALTRYIVRHVLPAGPILLAGDDTIDGHPGRARLRQGAAPRPRPLVPLLHRLALRPSLGRPGHPRPIPVRRSPLGAARARGPLP